MAKKHKNKYIPHLAEFFFEPKYNWNKEKAKEMYEGNSHIYNDQIWYGDCMKKMAQMDAASVQLVIADPPFGIDFSGKESIYNRKASNVVDDYREVIENYREFSLSWIRKLPRIMKKSSSAFIISGWTNLEYVLEGIRLAKLHLVNHIVWKYQFGPFTSRKWVSSHYHILWVVKDPKKYFYHRITHYNLDVWEDLPRTYKAKQKKNGTKLPEELIQRMIDFTTKPGDLVFDPFMGNGTTAVAAKLNYRHYCGCELNHKMKLIIRMNIEQAEVGKSYIRYKDRLEPLEKLAEKDLSYKKAYLLYCKEKGISFTNLSRHDLDEGQKIKETKKSTTKETKTRYTPLCPVA